MAQSIGFVGLGNMGSKMAIRLIESGYKVFLYDINLERVEVCVRHGGIAATSLQDLASNADVVLTSLPDSVVVENVCLGGNGLIEAMDEGKILIEVSTIDVETMQKLAEEGKKKGVQVVDAPVSGGTLEASKGMLVFLIGAEQEVYESVLPILQHLGKKIYRIGDPGTGKAIKLVNNMMTLGNLLVASEAFQIGLRAGVEPERMVEVLSECAGRSFQFVKRAPRWMNDDWEPGFPIQLAEKDLRLVLSMSKKLQMETPIADMIWKYYRDAREQGLGELDIASVKKVVEKYSLGEKGKN